MHKQFLLLFIIVINMSLYSQVVIKDEINLDDLEVNKDETESAGLFMPFYGKVKETLYSVYNIVCSEARNELIVDGTFYQFGPCWGWDCGITGTCFCSSNISQLVENIPMGTFIDIKIQKCLNWDGGTNYYWKVLEHYFEIYSSTSNYKQYKIYSRLDESSQWENVGWLEFWKTTAPDCSSAEGNYCSENFDEVMPPIGIKEHKKTFTPEIDYCSSVPGRIAFFTPVYWPANRFSNVNNLTTDDINACFDLQTQTWKFNTAIDTVELNFIIDTCKNNITSIPATVISSLEEVNSIPEYKCLTALESFVGHRHYPYEIPPNGYMIKEVILLHENQHKNKWNEYLQKYLNEYEKIFIDSNPDCDTYLSPEVAVQEGLNLLLEKFSLLWNKFNNDYRWDVGLDKTNPDYEDLKKTEELRANNSTDVVKKIYDYIWELADHCFVQN